MLPALPAPFQKGTRVLMEMRTWGTAPPSSSSDAWQKSVVEPNVIGDSASSYVLPCLSVVMGLGMSGNFGSSLSADHVQCMWWVSHRDQTPSDWM